MTRTVSFSFKKFISFRFILLDDLFQQVDVVGEGLLTGRSQRAGRQRPIVLKRFRNRQVTRLLQRSDMCRYVAVRHIQSIAHFGKRQLQRGGEHRHNRQPPFLVYYAIELKEWFRVHVSSLRFSVKYKYTPEARCSTPKKKPMIP